MSFVVYKHGITISNSSFTGAAGLAINNNFRTIGDLFDTVTTGPGGSSSQLQYNNAGSFAGASFTTDGTNLISPEFGFGTKIQNLIESSVNFQNTNATTWWGLNGTSLTYDNAAPDGSLLAISSVMDNGVYNVYGPVGGVATTVVPYTMSCWMKGGSGGETVQLQSNSVTPTNYASSPIALTTSWVRYSFTFTPDDDLASLFYPISTADGQTVLVFGPQLEVGSTLGPFLPRNTDDTNADTYGIAATNVSTHFPSANGITQPLSLFNGSYIYTTSVGSTLLVAQNINNVGNGILTTNARGNPILQGWDTNYGSQIAGSYGFSRDGTPTIIGTLVADGFSGNGSALTNLTSGNLTGALPALDGSALTNLSLPNQSLNTTDSPTFNSIIGISGVNFNLKRGLDGFAFLTYDTSYALQLNCGAVNFNGGAVNMETGLGSGGGTLNMDGGSIVNCGGLTLPLSGGVDGALQNLGNQIATLTPASVGLGGGISTTLNWLDGDGSTPHSLTIVNGIITAAS